MYYCFVIWAPRGNITLKIKKNNNNKKVKLEFKKIKEKTKSSKRSACMLKKRVAHPFFALRPI